MMKLDDMRTPTCPNCGGAKLETEDIIDTYADTIENIYTEFTVGVCPNCGRQFSYTQTYNLEPTGYEDLIDITEDEKEDEDDE